VKEVLMKERMKKRMRDKVEGKKQTAVTKKREERRS
jgi:hypothetical protein